MRRIICDVLIVITTISPLEADPTNSDELTSFGEQSRPPIVDSLTDPPPQMTDNSAKQWCIYQEFIFVHCARAVKGDHHVIDSDCVASDYSQFGDDSRCETW